MYNIKVLCLALCLITINAQVHHYNYWSHGYNWRGTCKNGDKQSPINIIEDNVKKASVLDRYLIIEDMGVASKLRVYSLGNVIVADIEKFSTYPDIRVPATKYMLGKETGEEDDDTENVSYVHVTPKRFRAHSKGENPIDGKYPPADVQIEAVVNKGQTKLCDIRECIVIFAIQYEFNIDDSDDDDDDDDEDPDNLVQFLIENVPYKAGYENEEFYEDDLDLNDYIPDDISYYTWDGSLTFPPCFENVLWILFENHLDISMEQVAEYQYYISHLYGRDCKDKRDGECFPRRSKTNNRAWQLLNDRTVRYFKEPFKSLKDKDPYPHPPHKYHKDDDDDDDSDDDDDKHYGHDIGEGKRYYDDDDDHHNHDEHHKHDEHHGYRHGYSDRLYHH